MAFNFLNTMSSFLQGIGKNTSMNLNGDPMAGVDSAINGSAAAQASAEADRRKKMNQEADGATGNPGILSDLKRRLRVFGI